MTERVFLHPRRPVPNRCVVDASSIFLGHLLQLRGIGYLVLVLVAAQLCQVQAEQVCCGNLCQSVWSRPLRFRGRRWVQRGVGFAGQVELWVLQMEITLAPCSACVAHGPSGRPWFARPQEGSQSGLRSRFTAVAQLVGELNLGGDTAPVFDGVACHLACVCCGTTCNNDDLVNRAQHRVVDVQLVEGEAVAPSRRNGEGLLNCGGLLVDFLSP